MVGPVPRPPQRVIVRRSAQTWRASGDTPRHVGTLAYCGPYVAIMAVARTARCSCHRPWPRTCRFWGVLARRVIDARRRRRGHRLTGGFTVWPRKCYLHLTAAPAHRVLAGSIGVGNRGPKPLPRPAAHRPACRWPIRGSRQEPRTTPRENSSRTGGYQCPSAPGAGCSRSHNASRSRSSGRTCDSSSAPRSIRE